MSGEYLFSGFSGKPNWITVILCFITRQGGVSLPTQLPAVGMASKSIEESASALRCHLRIRIFHR